MSVTSSFLQLESDSPLRLGNEVESTIRFNRGEYMQEWGWIWSVLTDSKILHSGLMMISSASSFKSWTEPALSILSFLQFSFIVLTLVWNESLTADPTKYILTYVSLVGSKFKSKTFPVLIIFRLSRTMRLSTFYGRLISRVLIISAIINTSRLLDRLGEASWLRSYCDFI